MSVIDPANIEKNADDLIAQGLAGEGPLAQHFKDAFTKAQTEAPADYAYAHRNDATTAQQSPEELKAAVGAKMDADAVAVKKALIDAAKGDTNAGLDMNQVTGLASSASTVASAMSSGSVFGMIMAIPQLLSNSIIGDYVKAAISYFFGGDDKPASFGDALAQVRLNKGMENIATQLKADPASLQAAFAISRDVQVAQADNSDVSVTYTRGAGAGATTITETGRFDKDQQTLTFDKAHYHTGDNRDGDLSNSQPMIVKVKPEDIDPTTGKLRIDDTLKGAVLTQASSMESLIPAATPAAPGAAQSK